MQLHELKRRTANKKKKRVGKIMRKVKKNAKK